jgi:hypothetical protein
MKRAVGPNAMSQRCNAAVLSRVAASASVRRVDRIGATTARLVRGEGGQSSAEFVATLPAALLVGLVVWQFALAGHTGWLCANAARVAARAAAVEDDPTAAARSALPRAMARGLRVSGGDGEPVEVRVRVPLLHPRWRGPIDWRASAALEPRP